MLVLIVAGIARILHCDTVPGKTWARWADVYTNAGAAAVTTDVVTYTNLGSDSYGFIYATPSAASSAITEWDTYTGDRDVGLAFGNEQAFWEPDTGLGSGAGSDDVFFVKHVTVPAGGTYQFSALLNSALDTNATWTVSLASGQCPGTIPSGCIGSINSTTGLYSAPDAPPPGGKVTIPRRTVPAARRPPTASCRRGPSASPGSRRA